MYEDPYFFVTRLAGTYKNSSVKAMACIFYEFTGVCVSVRCVCVCIYIYIYIYISLSSVEWISKERSTLIP